ncbi:MAG TPA: head-tail adaptor protein [Patescibacteria group bacterium]|nr:head-tail adaptor protein [Patescibacteria group bacterium]
MSFDTLLIHRLAVERATSGTLDEYGQPTRTYATLATFRGRLEPKSAREVAALSGAGAVVSNHTLYARPRDLRESDRIHFVPDDGRRFEVTAIRDPAGAGHHLTIDLTLIRAGV